MPSKLIIDEKLSSPAIVPPRAARRSVTGAGSGDGAAAGAEGAAAGGAEAGAADGRLSGKGASEGDASSSSGGDNESPRSRALRRKGPVEEPVDQACEHDILDELIDGEKVRALRGAIQELPEAYRDAVVLCDIEERNYDEAARLMGCPVGTVRSRLHRARALLAGKLKRLRPAGRTLQVVVG